MPVRITPELATELCDYIVDKIDVGTGTAILEVYEGAQPASPNAAPTGPLLVTFDLPNPAFGDAAITASGATATAEDILPADAIANGTAGFFRITTRDGVPLIDGSVSDLAGAGQLKLSSTTVVANVSVVIGSLTLTQRAF